MSAKPSPSTEGLRAMLIQALQAYELAQVTQIQTERQVKAEQQQHLDTLQKQQQTQLQQVETDQKQETAVARTEQELISQLLALIEQVKQGAIDLLEKAGLAHISGAPLRLDETAVPTRRDDEAVTKAFASAQVAYTDLRTALFRLALTYTDTVQWEEARRIVQPLLNDTLSPLYTDARELLCETYYHPAVVALQTGDWDKARQGFEAVFKINANYQETGKLLRESYLHPAQEALKTGRLEETRQLLEEWLKSRQDDTEIRDLLCETYYQPAVEAMRAGDWMVARRSLDNILNIDRTYRDTTSCLRKTHLFPASAALKTGQLDEARQHITAWLSLHRDDAEMRDLLCETYYQQALQAIQNKDWEQALDYLKQLRALNSTYRDSADWSRRYPLLAWVRGSVKLAQDFSQQGYQVLSVAYSPDGKLLALGCGDSAIRICDGATGQLLYPLKGHNGYVTSIAFSPDGKLLATGGYDQTIKIWNVATGQMLYSQQGGNSISKLIFSPDQRFLASTEPISAARPVRAARTPASAPSIPMGVKMWDVSTGKLLNNQSAYCVAFSSDSQIIAWGMTDNTVMVSRSIAGQSTYSISGATAMITDVFFSPDKQYLASVSQDFTVKVWELATRQLRYTLDGYIMTFSPDGKFLASGGSDEVVKLWETATGHLLLPMGRSKTHMRSIVFSPDGLLLALGCEDSSIRVLDVTTGRELHTLNLYQGGYAYAVSNIVFSPNGSHLAAAGEEGTVNVWKSEI